MTNSLQKSFLIFLLTTSTILAKAQSTWPSSTWSNAFNISSALPSSAAELSGMYWNCETSRLYAIGDGGYVYILQYNKTSNSYMLLGSTSGIGGPEGVTQVDNLANEFYTIDENSYEIRKYTYNTAFSAITKVKSWDLLQSPSPMTDTGNSGPEGISFVPDSYLQKVGFISSVTGKTVTSTKGMGGLLFIAHQNGGYVWVFDVNPSVNNDFLYVGKYKTNRTESCEAAFDRSTGLMYVLHNLDDNYLEVTDLTTTLVSGEYKLKTIKEYFIPNPTGSINVEGFALSPKFPTETNMGAWLCRDVKVADNADAVRWFNPFTADGTDISTEVPNVEKQTEPITVFPNPALDFITINNSDTDMKDCSVHIYSGIGQLVIEKKKLNFPTRINLNNIKSGIYVVKISANNQIKALKTIIK